LAPPTNVSVGHRLVLCEGFAWGLSVTSYMPTKIVFHARGSAVSSLEDGVNATARLVNDPALDSVSGRYFNRTEEARAQARAYDGPARRRLREISTGWGDPVASV
jgi:hypothetical protein